MNGTTEEGWGRRYVTAWGSDVWGSRSWAAESDVCEEARENHVDARDREAYIDNRYRKHWLYTMASDYKIDCKRMADAPRGKVFDMACASEAEHLTGFMFSCIDRNSARQGKQAAGPLFRKARPRQPF
jgi:hypothetical protein